jgi:DnaJ-class molecular chaperone
MDKNLEWYHIEECFLCNGTGKCLVQGQYTFESEEEDCPHCQGEGKIKIMKR